MTRVWCALALLALRVSAGPHEAVITLNTVRAVRRTADPFIGFSVSPQILLNNHYGVSTVRMLAALSPAVLRIGDEDSDKLAFRSSSGNPSAVVFTELQWAGLNMFAAEAGLNLIFSVSPHSDWKQLFNSSRRLGFNPSWQLGYKLKKNESSHEFGEGLVQLQQILKDLQLQHSAILGPDFQVCDSCSYERQISDIFQEVGDLVNAVTLQLDPLESKEDDKLLKLFTSVERATKKRSLKPGRFRNGFKKQIWVAEASGVEEGYSGDFSDALRWALKLGVLAQVGVNSVLRRPSQLISPSPDYWVSLLHRRLVGPAVLGLRSSNVSGVRAFAHCAAARPGAVVWGANRGPAPANLSLRVGARLDHAELYLLTRDTWEDAEIGNTLLNGQLLHMSTGELPSLSGRPIRLGSNMSLALPPESVFFIVLPLRVPACLLPPATAPSYEPQRLPTVSVKIPTSDLLNAAVLPDPKHKGEFDFVKGGLYDTAGKARQSRGNVQEDMEKSSKLVLESLRAHLSGYDKQSEKKEFGKLMDMTLAAIDNGGSTDEPGPRGGDSMLVTTEESRDEIPMIQTPLPVLTVENYENFEGDSPQPSGDDQDSKIISLSLIPPKEQSTDEEGAGAILTMSFNPAQTINRFGSGVSGNMSRNKDMRESKITRIKRAENKAALIVEPLEGIENSLLHKRIQFLKKNRNMTNMAKGQESKENPPKNSVVMDLIDHSKDNNHQISGSINNTTKIIQKKGRAAFEPPITQQINNPGALHYHPGEFYETLGSLKVHQNVSLKDIEKADEEAIDLMIEKTQHKTSQSQVSSKSGSEKHIVERKLDESTTENAEKYFKCDDEKTQRVTSGSHETTVNDNGKCSTSERNANIHHSYELTMDVSKKTNERRIEKALESPKPIVINADGGDYGHGTKTGLRTKRELGDISNITKLLFPEGGNLTNSNHSVKPQIGMYVMDQSEGHKLFLEATVQEQSLEKKYNTELYDNVTTEPTKIKISVRHRNKTNSGAEMDQNFFLLKNLVSDNSFGAPLKKKTYHDEPEKAISKNIQTALKDSEALNRDEALTQSSTPRAFVIELNENGTPLKYDSTVNKNDSKQALLNQHDEVMNSSKVPISYEEERNQNIPKMDSLQSLLRKFSPDFKPINTGEGAKKIHLENEILEKNNRNHGKPEETIKNSMVGNVKSFSDAILGSVQAFSSRQMHSTSKKNTGLFQNSYNIDTSDIPERNDQNPYNTQSPLKASSSILISKIAQGSNLPTLSPAFYDFTTEHVKLSSPLQKPKTHSDSSSFIGGATPIEIPPTLGQIKLTEPPILRAIVQNKHKNYHTSHQGRPSSLELLIAKHKEKLDALKLRLQQARERALEAKRNKIITQHSAHNLHAVVKRSIFNVRSANRIEGGKKARSNFPGNKGLITLLEDGVVKSSIPYETNSKHKTGQITSADMKDTSSEEFSLSQTSPKNLETVLKVSTELNTSLNKSQPYNNVQIEEKLEISNLGPEPISFWEVRRLRKPAEQEDVFKSERKPRAIHYPCIRDRFFSDYDAEDQTKVLNKNINLVDSKRSLQLPSGKNAPKNSLPVEEGDNPTRNQLILTENKTKVKAFNLNHKEQLKKSKRSVDGALNGEEVKMLQLLTNKIMTSDVANEIPENSEEIENVVQAMLDETISKAVPGKSGISKLYELAKEYQNTHHDSLDLFGSAKKSADSSDDEKLLEGWEEVKLDDMEVQDGEEGPGKYGKSVTPNRIVDFNTHRETSPNPFADTTTDDDNHSMLHLQESEKKISDSDESKQLIDSFIEKIELIMRDITSTVKHGLL